MQWNNNIIGGDSSMKHITKILMGLFIIYLQILWLLIGVFAVPLFCIARAINKLMDCINEYSTDFKKQMEEI